MTTEPNITKLPKWAQAHIQGLGRERDTAVRALNKYVDDQIPSPFYCDEIECTGEDDGPSFKRRYFQGNSITVGYCGIELRVLLRNERIELSWGSLKYTSVEIALIPTSYAQACLVSKENMR